MAKAKKTADPELVDSFVEKDLTGKQSKSSGDHFQEWECKIVKGKAEKLKMNRAVVKITEYEAEVLNKGVEEGGNSYGKMYFRPE
jgi:hypothetical protein